MSNTNWTLCFLFLFLRGGARLPGYKGGSGRKGKWVCLGFVHCLEFPNNKIMLGELKKSMHYLTQTLRMLGCFWLVGFQACIHGSTSSTRLIQEFRGQLTICLLSWPLNGNALVQQCWNKLLMVTCWQGYSSFAFPGSKESMAFPYSLWPQDQWSNGSFAHQDTARKMTREEIFPLFEAFQFSLSLLFFVVLWFWDRASPYSPCCLGILDLVGLKLIEICMPLPPGCWDERCIPPCPEASQFS